MLSIQECLENIKNAVLGRDVRQSIHDGIKGINDESKADMKKKQDTIDTYTSKMDLLNDKYEEQIKNLTLASPSDAEIVDARRDEGGTVHATLKERIDTDISDLNYRLGNAEGIVYTCETKYYGEAPYLKFLVEDVTSISKDIELLELRYTNPETGKEVSIDTNEEKIYINFIGVKPFKIEISVGRRYLPDPEEGEQLKIGHCKLIIKDSASDLTENNKKDINQLNTKVTNIENKIRTYYAKDDGTTMSYAQNLTPGVGYFVFSDSFASIMTIKKNNNIYTLDIKNIMGTYSGIYLPSDRSQMISISLNSGQSLTIMGAKFE